MAFVLADRVKESCSSPGTGTVTLLGAATGYQAFSAGIGANNTTYYTIADQGGANWEVGYGTIGAGGTTLARTTVLASSNSGSLVNFSSGSQDVFCDYAAGKAVFVDSNNKVSGYAITGGTIDGTTIGATTAADATVNELYVNQYATLAASTTASAPLKMPYGVAPTSPAAGDIWTSNTGLYFKNSSGTIEQLDLGSNTAGTLSNPVITVAGSGATIDVSSVNAVLFSLPAWQGDYQQYIVPAATGLALTDNSANYLVVSYNAGSPVYSIITNPALITNSDVVGATLLWRSGTEVHYQAINWGLSTASRVNRRLVQTDRYQRATGLALGESTGNVITLTAGNVWYGVSEIIEGAVTSASSNADFYYHVAGVWTKSTVSTYDITQYDNGTALATLSNGRYAVNWVYRYLDGSGLPKLAYILGSGNYTQAQALASSVPTPPPILSTMAILVGRIIVLKNAATAFEIDSAFTQVFSSTTVTSHNDLSGLQGGTTDEYYHLSNAQHTIATQAASASTNGYLTSTDWTTFNNKAAPFTYTTSYIPYGQGTTTPNQSSSLTFASSTLTAPVVSASNGLVVNSNTVSASYSIPSGSSASSVGPMTVASGQSVTVPSGSRWVVL